MPEWTETVGSGSVGRSQTGLDSDDSIEINNVAMDSIVDPEEEINVTVSIGHFIPFITPSDGDYCNPGFFQSGMSLEIRVVRAGATVASETECVGDLSTNISMDTSFTAPISTGEHGPYTVELRGGISGNLLDSFNYGTINVIGEEPNPPQVSIADMNLNDGTLVVDFDHENVDPVEVAVFSGGSLIDNQIVDTPDDNGSSSATLTGITGGVYEITARGYGTGGRQGTDSLEIEFSENGNGDNGDNGNGDNGGQQPDDGPFGMDTTSLILAGGLGLAGAGAVAFVATEEDNN